MLHLTHHGNSGFFSNASSALHKIIQYFLNNKSLPDKLDTTNLFLMYKPNQLENVTYDFFKHYDSINIDIPYEQYNNIINSDNQFSNYKEVNYNSFTIFIRKYFTPSDKINNIYNKLINKYKINLENCISIYFRGTDKRRETRIDSFESYYNKIIEIINISGNKDIQILIQSDTAQFVDYMKERLINYNLIIINENKSSYYGQGIHISKTTKENYIDMHFLLATFLIISKSKYIICSSCNCSIWMMYFRENAENIYQNLNKKWL